MNTTMYPTAAPRCNPISMAERLPNPDPRTMDYAARRIATRYNVGLPLARVVAELIGASLEAR
jgi:hypothetical protein